MRIYEREGEVTPIPKNRKKKGDDLGDNSTIATMISGGDLNQNSEKDTQVPLNLTIPNSTQAMDSTTPTTGYIDLNGNIVKSPPTSASTDSSSQTHQPVVMYYAVPVPVSSVLHPDQLLASRSMETTIIGMSHLDVTDDGNGRIKRGSSLDNFSSALSPTNDIDVMIPYSRLSEDTLNMALDAVLDCTPRPSLDGFSQHHRSQSAYDNRVSDLSLQMLNYLACNDRDSTARCNLESIPVAGELNLQEVDDMISQASQRSYFNSLFGGISYQNGMDMTYSDQHTVDQPQYYTGGEGHNIVDES